MKKVYSSFLSLFFILLFSAQLAANKNGTILMSAILTPGQAKVTNAPKAKGLLTVIVEKDRSITINGVFDSLSGAITNCHFHKGLLGEAGGVVLDLKPYLKGNRIYAKSLVITKTLLTQLMTDSIYINVHTTLNSGGEIRGQVYNRTDYHFWTIMSGAFEVPNPVVSNAIGLSSIVLSRTGTRLDYKIVVNGLSGPITGAHIHRGSSVEAGPVAYNLAINGNILTGSISNVSSGFVDSLAAGLTYVNIHTTANPTGEIRGQLGFTAGPFAFDALLLGANEVPAVTTTANGLAVGWALENLDSIQYAVIYSGLTPTMAHFHTGVATGTGGVLADLRPYNRAPNAAYVGRVGTNPDVLTRFLMDSIYVNIHTTANPNGEIRGQMITSLHEGMVADLCGKQEVPVNATAGFGAGYVSFDRTKTTGYTSVYTTGMTGNAINGHIHVGAKGVNGGVLLDLGLVATNFVNGAFTLPRTTLFDTIANGLTYLNVHTTANQNGEIRGQLGKALTPDCLPTAIFELNGEKLMAKVFPNPANDVINLIFESNQAFESQIVVSDLIGRSVSMKNFKVEDGENQLPISISNLSNGLYFIQLKKNGNAIFTEKIVKE
jgi:hypothetical protein